MHKKMLAKDSGGKIAETSYAESITTVLSALVFCFRTFGGTVKGKYFKIGGALRRQYKQAHN